MSTNNCMDCANCQPSKRTEYYRVCGYKPPMPAAMRGNWAARVSAWIDPKEPFTDCPAFSPKAPVSPPASPGAAYWLNKPDEPAKASQHAAMAQPASPAPRGEEGDPSPGTARDASRLEEPEEAAAIKLLDHFFSLLIHQNRSLKPAWALLKSRLANPPKLGGFHE